MLLITVEILGIFGVLLVMFAYFFLATGHLNAHDMLYPFLNLIGALLIIVSLIFEWNLPSFVMESLWALISVFGIYKAYQFRLRTNATRKQNQT